MTTILGTPVGVIFQWKCFIYSHMHLEMKAFLAFHCLVCMIAFWNRYYLQKCVEACHAKSKLRLKKENYQIIRSKLDYNRDNLLLYYTIKNKFSSRKLMVGRFRLSTVTTKKVINWPPSHISQWIMNETGLSNQFMHRAYVKELV